MRSDATNTSSHRRRRSRSRAGIVAGLALAFVVPLAAAQTENRFDQALREYDKAWKTLSDELVRQNNAVRTIRKNTKRVQAMSLEDRQNLDAWESDISHQLNVLSEGRRLRTSYRNQYGPKAELIAAQGYTELLRMDADTYSRSRDSFVLDMRERARGVITENMINVAEAGARTLYDLVTKRLTMTADWYELITKQNAETGKTGSRSQAAFNLFAAYLIAKGLKAAPDVLADKNLVGEKLTDLIPRRTRTGSEPTPLGNGGARPAQPGAQETTPPAGPKSGSDTQVLPPPDLPGDAMSGTRPRTGPGDTQQLPPPELPGAETPTTGPNNTEILPPPELPGSGTGSRPSTGAPSESKPRRLPSEEDITADSSSFPAAAQRDLTELAAEARRVGVPEERVQDLVRNGQRTGNTTEQAEARLELTKEIMKRTGWDVDLPRAEKLSLTQAYLHSRRGGLTSGDLRFLQGQLSRDPNYFDNLRRRGNVDGEGNFVPGLGPKQARELRDAYTSRTRPTTGSKPPRAIPSGISVPKTGDDGTGTATVAPPGNASGANPSTGGKVPPIKPPTMPDLSSSSTSTSGSTSAPTNVRPTTGGSSASEGNVSVGEPYEQTAAVIPPIQFELHPLSRAPEPAEDLTDLVNEDSLDLLHLGDATGDGDGRNDVFQRMMIDSATNDSNGVIVLAGARRPAPRVGLARQLWGAFRQGLSRPRRSRVEIGLEPASSYRSSFGRPMGTTAPRGERRTSQAQSSEPRVKVFIRSLGVSTGEAFQAYFFNEGPDPIRIRGEGIVVEPVKKRAQQQLTKELQRTLGKVAGDKQVTLKLSAYCLELLREPPNPGMMFRIADEAIQQRFAPMRRILQASRKLQDMGLLHPDSDPAQYFHSIRQWALWTRENDFDASSFEKAFIERTKKNFAASRQDWTKDIEKVVRGLVPNRWGDIQRVIEESTTLLDSAR